MAALAQVIIPGPAESYNATSSLTYSERSKSVSPTPARQSYPRGPVNPQARLLDAGFLYSSTSSSVAQESSHGVGLPASGNAGAATRGGGGGALGNASGARMALTEMDGSPMQPLDEVPDSARAVAADCGARDVTQMLDESSCTAEDEVTLSGVEELNLGTDSSDSTASVAVSSSSDEGGACGCGCADLGERQHLVRKKRRYSRGAAVESTHMPMANSICSIATDVVQHIAQSPDSAIPQTAKIDELGSAAALHANRSPHHHRPAGATSVTSALRKEPSLSNFKSRVVASVSSSESLAESSRRGVYFDEETTKTHDGMLPLHRAFDQLVWRFFQSKIGVPIVYPIPVAAALPIAPLDRDSGTVIPTAASIAGPPLPCTAPIEPPAALAAVVRTIFLDGAFAAGNRAHLRGLLRLSEDLYSRLEHAVNGVHEETAAAPISEDRNENSTGCSDASDPRMLDDECVDAEEAAIEAATRASDAAARAYKERRSEPGTAVLRGGGGTCAKLSATHLPWVLQLVHLVRHAVCAYPEPLQQPTRGSPACDGDGRSFAPAISCTAF